MPPHTNIHHLGALPGYTSVWMLCLKNGIGMSVLGYHYFGMVFRVEPTYDTWSQDPAVYPRALQHPDIDLEESTVESEAGTFPVSV